MAALSGKAAHTNLTKSNVAAHPTARAVRSSQALVRWGFWGRVARVVKYDAGIRVNTYVILVIAFCAISRSQIKKFHRDGRAASDVRQLPVAG